MRLRIVASAVAVAAVGSLPAGGVDRSDELHFPRCGEVFAYVTVPRENVTTDLVPDPFVPALDPAGRPAVQVRAADCAITLGGSTSYVLWSEVRVTIVAPRPPATSAELHVVGHELDWTSNSRRFNAWARRGIPELDDLIHDTRDMARVSVADPVTGIDTAFRYVSDGHNGWGFRMEALVQHPIQAGGVPLTADAYRQTSQGGVLFRAESHDPGDRFGWAEIDLYAHHGSRLAEVLAGGDGCSKDGTHCHVIAAVNGYSVTILNERFQRMIVS